jgi:glycosyltransferase involved in cell wall biosynthesis
MTPVRIMRIVAPMHVAGPALQVSTLMRDLDPDVFEQRLYVGSPRPIADSTGPIVDSPGPRIAPDARPFADLRALPALRALTAAMREFRPDVVHTHTAQAGTLGRIAAVLARVPVRVHTFHDHLLRGYLPHAKTAVRAERALARRTHRLLAVSQRVRDDLVAARIGRRRQYEVVAPGVAVPPPPSRAEARHALGLPETGPVVVVVGQVTQAKRPDRMLAVAQEVRHTLGDVRFVVSGEGDLLPQTVSGAQGLGVTFLPSRPDVEIMYAAADLVLQTSDHEELPVSLIEAALCERPAVATDVGEVSEVVRHGETGLVTPVDVSSLSDAVIRLLRDDTLRRWMGQQATAAANRRFGSARLVDDMADLYLRLADRRPVAEPALL